MLFVVKVCNKMVFGNKQYIILLFFYRHHDVAPVPEVVEDMKVCTRFLFSSEFVGFW